MNRKPTSRGLRFGKMLSRRAAMPVLMLAVLSGGAAAGLASGASAAPLAQSTPQAIPPQAMQQIKALQTEKHGRSAAQRKVSSELLYADRQSRGLAIAAGVATLKTGVDVDAQGMTEVDISANVSDALLAKLKGLGADVVYARPEYHTIRARLPLHQAETVAGDPRVLFVQPKQEGTTVGNARAEAAAGASRSTAADGAAPASLLAPGLPAGFGTRAAQVRARLGSALTASSQTNAVPSAKVNTSEGDKTHRADLARATFGANGSGVKIGVLSDGVNSLASLQASGDLPASVTVLPGKAGSGNEGAAMLEIVYDLAPGAQLYFATGNGGATVMADNIRALRQAGCDIIVDDITYFAESAFQTGQAPGVVSPTNGGVITQAVNDVVASGALYFSSAGNSGNLDDVQSGAWEGNFRDGGPVSSDPADGRFHDFDPGPAVVTGDTLTKVSGPIILEWSDPLGASNNDYDLYAINSGGTVVASSTDIQDGSAPQDPFEGFSASALTAGNRIVIVKFNGADRFLHLTTNRGRLALGTAGQTSGHNAGPATITVGATPAAGAFAAGQPAGPFPNPFGPANVTETFSSDGPRQFFYKPNGTPITPGNVLAGGGVALPKPEITAADGVSCAAPGFSPFFGTSAAAPHAGAIAALVKSANPSFSNFQVASYLARTAIDIEAHGPDRDSGAGILDAYQAVALAKATSVFVFLPVTRR